MPDAPRITSPRAEAPKPAAPRPAPEFTSRVSEVQARHQTQQDVRKGRPQPAVARPAEQPPRARDASVGDQPRQTPGLRPRPENQRMLDEFRAAKLARQNSGHDVDHRPRTAENAAARAESRAVRRGELPDRRRHDAQHLDPAADLRRPRATAQERQPAASPQRPDKKQPDGRPAAPDKQGDLINPAPPERKSPVREDPHRHDLGIAATELGSLVAGAGGLAELATALDFAAKGWKVKTSVKPGNDGSSQDQKRADVTGGPARVPD